MEAWELDAREQIRDLVAAYNAHGDRGRFDELLALFANGASMDIGDGVTYEGVDAIRSIFTDTRDSVIDADSSTTSVGSCSLSPTGNTPPDTPTSRS